MVKTLPQLVFATFIISGITVILSLVALGTDQWVTASVDLNAMVNTTVISTTDNDVSYGLFAGSYSRTVSTNEIYSLQIINTLIYIVGILYQPYSNGSAMIRVGTANVRFTKDSDFSRLKQIFGDTGSTDLLITCDFGRNKCALLCGYTFSIRWYYLEALFESDITDAYGQCNIVRSLKNLNADVEMSLNPQSRADEVVRDGFINSGLWLSTVLFLIISCLFGIISTILALWNAVSNPVETLLSTLGLFIYTCVSCLCILIVIILWTIQFSVTLRNNIAIYDTIASIGRHDPATLGYSYWLTIVAFVGYGSNIAILIVRQVLINKEPDNIVNIEDKNDNTIILF